MATAAIADGVPPSLDAFAGRKCRKNSVCGSALKLERSEACALAAEKCPDRRIFRRASLHGLIFGRLGRRLVDRQPKRFEPVTQCRTVESQDITGLRLVAVSVSQDLHEQDSFDGRDDLRIESPIGAIQQRFDQRLQVEFLVSRKRSGLGQSPAQVAGAETPAG